MKAHAVGHGMVFSVTLLTLPVGCGGNGAKDPQPSSLANTDTATLVKENCGDCHDPGDGSYSGRTLSVVAGAMVFPANLTPDPDNGIGSWTDDQIKNAMRTGIDDEGKPLCATMPRFGQLTAEQVDHIVGFLRALPPVAKAIPESTCVDGG